MPTPTTPRRAPAPALLHRFQLWAESASAPLTPGQRLELRLEALDLAAELEQASAALPGEMSRKVASRAGELRQDADRLGREFSRGAA